MTTVDGTPPLLMATVDETPLPLIPSTPVAYQLTVQAAEIILAHTKSGWNEGLNISFPAMYPAVITVPLYICTQIIATYTNSSESSDEVI